MRKKILVVMVGSIVIGLLIANGYLYSKSQNLRSSNAALLTDHFKANDYYVLSVEPTMNSLVKGDFSTQLKSIMHVRKGISYLEHTMPFLFYTRGQYQYPILPEDYLLVFVCEIEEWTRTAFKQLQTGQALSATQVNEAESYLGNVKNTATITEEFLTRYPSQELYNEINSHNPELLKMFLELLSAYGGRHED